MEAIQASFNLWMCQQMVGHQTMEYYLATARNKLLRLITKEMNLKCNVLREESQTPSPHTAGFHLQDILEQAKL